MLTEKGRVWSAGFIYEEGTITISNQTRKKKTPPSYLNREPIRKHGLIMGSKHLSNEEVKFREKLYSKIHGMNRISRGLKGGDETCPS